MANYGEYFEKSINEFAEGVEKFAKGAFEDGLLRSNRAINPGQVGRNGWWDRGLTGTVRGLNADEGLTDAIKNSFTKGTAEGKRVADWGAIAGTTLGVSAGYRIASGGGLYRDKNGNADIIGIPFI